MQGLCREHCRLTNISDCDDTRVMLAAFDDDAAKYSFADDGARIVDIGAAGTSMRFLTAFFASQEGAEVVCRAQADHGRPQGGEDAAEEGGGAHHIRKPE